ncbi:MAG: hypothetical protein LBS11_02090 [Oscillospiraceae bacterium]|jgi:acetyl esterase/lipase|nr:hypothetical protein [Oscillospiraceae bacterium]
MRKPLAALLCLSMLLGMAALPAIAADDPLAFDPARESAVITVTIDGTPVEVLAYEAVPYVGKPIEMKLEPGMFGPPPTNPYAYQSLSIYIPKASQGSQSAPIYLVTGNAGWFSTANSPLLRDGEVFDRAQAGQIGAGAANIGEALARGFIVVNLGARGRGLTSTDGLLVGKAPAVVVDAKAAARWLRYNDAAMPGDAERVIADGTSGGGGLVTILGASGNSADYYPYLEEIGAAGVVDGVSTIRDDIFALTGYCPITDLGHADMAYEWLYGGTRKDGAYTTSGGMPFAPAGDNKTWDELDESAKLASNTLAAAYPDYLEGLGLTLEDGEALTAGNMESVIIRWLEAGIDKAITEGAAVDPAVWAGRGVTIDGGKAAIADFGAYKAYVASQTALKNAPAFDNPGGEQSLFGSELVEASAFSLEVFGDGAAWEAALRDGLAEQLRLINPMEYINTAADAAPYWYVRHGGRDRDTSFNISVSLYYKLASDASIKDVNYALAYNTPHMGDYDAPEAFAWIDGILMASSD